MKMSTKGRYGLRVMMELATREGSGPVPVETIAQSQDISAQYIHLLTTGLRTAGLVRTTRGPNGGYELARPAATINAQEVIEALEGPTAPVDCVETPATCKRAGECVAREVWCEVAAAMNQVLKGLTLATLAARQRLRRDDSTDYCI